MTISSMPDNGNPAPDSDTPAGDQTFVERPVPKAKPPKPITQDKTTMILLLLAAFVAVGGVGFAVGHMTGTSGTANAAPSFGRGGGFGRAGASLAPGQTFNAGAFAGRAVGGLTGGVSGTVQSINGTTMTVQLSSGTSVTIDLTGTTTYHGTTPATSSDVKVGSSVTVQIAANASEAAPAPGSSGGRTLSAQDVIIVTNP
jgi:hypothetical protein